MLINSKKAQLKLEVLAGLFSILIVNWKGLFFKKLKKLFTVKSFTFYRVNLRIQSEFRKIQTRISLIKDTFHVMVFVSYEEIY